MVDWWYQGLEDKGVNWGVDGYRRDFLIAVILDLNSYFLTSQSTAVLAPLIVVCL
jgi:hypothetical protein